MNSNIAEMLEVYNLINSMEHKHLFKALVLWEMVDDISELNSEELEDTNDKLEECYNDYINNECYTTIVHPDIIEKYLM